MSQPLFEKYGLVLMSQLLEKKTKSPQSKKDTLCVFSYLFVGVKQLNKLFIRPVLMSQLLEKKTKSPQSKKILCVYFPIFLSELSSSTNFLFRSEVNVK
ncbi:hypothetical protein BFC23_07860 [Carnobacterium maltaromaticum]|nr:hypothetical protein BFC23_07860 [Carnobacterium maltaromaticum]